MPLVAFATNCRPLADMPKSAPAVPTLALCIPAYNAAWCLPRLLSSAVGQTVPFDEILVYDDQSTDDTAAVAEAHGARVIRGDVNAGCSVGKNRLAAEATSDWVHFHDADDDLLLHFVETVRTRLAVPDAPDVLLLHYEYRDFATGELLGQSAYDAGLMRTDPVEFVLRYKVPNFAVYRRQAFLQAGGFDLDPEVLFNEDAAVHHRLALAGLRFDYEPTLTCLNYRYSESMSVSNARKCARAQVAVLDKTAACLATRGEQALHAHALADGFWAAGTFAAVYEDWATAARAARAAASLGHRTPPTGGLAFRTLATVHGPWALRIREQAIRLMRPQLRASP